MRIHHFVLTMIGLCVAALGAWLVVSLLNELSGSGSARDASVAVASSDAPAAPVQDPDVARADRKDALAGLGGVDGQAEVRGPAGTPGPAGSNEPSGEVDIAAADLPASSAGADKEMARLEAHAPPAPPPRVLPQEAGPYRAAFIREPPSESEFPVIRLGEANWRVESGADGTIIAELDIVAADQDQRATLRLGGSFAGGDAVFLVTLALREGEFLPDAGGVMIEAITARGRGDRLVRIPAITLPYEDPKTIDFRVPVEDLLATLNFATWFDVGLRIDGARYTITIQNGDVTRDILSAVAFGA